LELMGKEGEAQEAVLSDLILSLDQSVIFSTFPSLFPSFPSFSFSSLLFLVADLSNVWPLVHGKGVEKIHSLWKDSQDKTIRVSFFLSFFCLTHFIHILFLVVCLEKVFDDYWDDREPCCVI
jgi:hypothetical protein